MVMKTIPYLPLELVLNIITCSLPSSLDALLDAAHPTNKLLPTFTLVCHETRRLANRYLRQHCVYLSSERRLGSFLRAIPDQPALQSVTSLSLAPFHNHIDDLPLCSWIRELLCYTCETLRRLIIDIPLRTLYPEDDHLAVRRVLREGFERLVNLEEFVSTQDELYLDVFDGEFAVLWKSWPKLKKLALWNVAADEVFWRHVSLHPSLQTLILSSPDCLMEVDPEVEYHKHTTRPIRVLICSAANRYRRRLDYLPNTDCQYPKEMMQISEYFLPDTHESWAFRLHQEYVKRAAEGGSLWDWEGEEIRYLAPIDNVS